ncbi:hypothetical protein [Clostridium manihotivorum]|uniref:Uncharacterized protein n=1 Tax=Clostridium manihotivorum TaxID=2320868 RepID=A0A410E185_9CLOT|nr:hypothetical protein [Clostridium manihotivorum]QAA35051.1 hypothetical protein C1I91_27300 [Clostridium manihotivorum]
MKLVIILILILALAVMYLYFNRKLSFSRQQYLLLSNQHKALREKYNAQAASLSNISVRYLNTTASNGVTLEGVFLMLAPIEKGPVINKINEKLQVRILEEAEVNNQIWYFVSLPLSTNFNSKGWMRKTDFSLIFSNSQEVMNR